nr:hypothetical protein [Tanacetum cinerariifolium]
TISHSDLSLPMYESFYFSIDPLQPVDRSDSQHEEFVDDLAQIISSPDNSLFLTDPSEIEAFLSFPSVNEDKVFDPGILLIGGVLFSQENLHIL